VLVAVPQCLLLHPDLIAAFPALEALVLAGGSRKGELALSVTRSLGGPDVSVTGGKPLDAALMLDLARVAEAQGLARLTWDGEVVALRTAPMQRFGRALVAPPPGAFLQATAEGEAVLLAAGLFVGA
jgi:23S rRNA (uracil1939-C5)-methyltransferase